MDGSSSAPSLVVMLVAGASGVTAKHSCFCPLAARGTGSAPLQGYRGKVSDGQMTGLGDVNLPVSSTAAWSPAAESRPEGILTRFRSGGGGRFEMDEWDGREQPRHGWMGRTWTHCRRGRVWAAWAARARGLGGWFRAVEALLRLPVD